MTLKDKINEDIKGAMKAKNQAALTALRELKSMILLEETKEGGDGTLSETDEIAIITKAIKQRKESYEMFASQGRAEQAAEQQAVITIMEKYLPQQLSEAEAEAKIKEIIESLGASSIKDMGKVMGQATKTLAGQVDNKLVSDLVKKLLA
ncbi:MAG: GatB/YqeY domain-containing protein [Thermonemataceae bacterium]|nr:GatB/YqeY domain-containing protein [Thermonemataceae bacterium]